MGIYSRIYSQSEAEITNWIYDRHPELEGLLEFPVCNQLVISTRTTYAWGWHLKWRVVSWDWAIFTYEILLCLAGESVIIELNWTLLHPAGIKELFVGEGKSTHTHTQAHNHVTVGSGKPISLDYSFTCLNVLRNDI